MLLHELFYLFRKQQAQSKVNLVFITRASAHLLLRSRCNSSRKEDARTRNEIPLKNNGKLPNEESHPVTDPLRENRRNRKELIAT